MIYKISDLLEKYAEDKCIDSILKQPISPPEHELDIDHLLDRLHADIQSHDSYRIIKVERLVRTLLVAVLLLTVVSITVVAAVLYFNRPKLITEANKKELEQESWFEPSVYQGDEKENSLFESNIPNNRLFSASDERTFFNSVTEFSVIQSDNTNNFITPEFICYNGNVVCFTRQDGSGWELKSGETLTISLPKYDSDAKKICQITYIKNNVYYSNNDVYTDATVAENIITADEDGIYYPCIMNWADNSISFHSGSIKIN